jgi:hypothetical protein
MSANILFFKAMCFKRLITFLAHNVPLQLATIAAKIRISTNASTDAVRVLRSLG